MVRRHTLTAFLAGSLLIAGPLTGCAAAGSPGTTSSSVTPAPASPSKQPPASTGLAKNLDVCKLIPVSKLNSVTGRTYVTASSHSATGESGCVYSSGDSNDIPNWLKFSIGIYYGGGEAKFSYLQTGLALGDPAVPVPGIGDKAVDVTYAVIAEFGTDVAFASDDEHPGTIQDIPQSDYLTLIGVLQAAR